MIFTLIDVAGQKNSHLIHWHTVSVYTKKFFNIFFWNKNICILGKHKTENGYTVT